MGEPKTLYAVVINHEEQYTVIPKDQKPPRGYELTGFSGSPDQVLGYLKKVWTKATDEDFKKIISLLK